MPSIRRTGIVAAFLAMPALAYRFAVVYRQRAGLPRRRTGELTPADRGLPYEATVVRSPTGDLPAWFIPALDGASGPGVVLVHGWESNRDRTLPNAEVLHAAGFHVLTFDVRGHGDNPPETLPISVAEFRDDAAAALDTLLARPEVTVGALLGHSLGAVGAILAAADAGERCAALVSTSAPADPRRLTRETFRLAHLPIPEPFATPLADLTTRVYLRPRGHAMRDLSASRAVARYAGPLLLVHGALDSVVPPVHLRRLEKAALRGAAARRAAGEPAGGPVEATLIADGHHSWLYELPAYRRTVAHFLATALSGPYAPEDAAERASAVETLRVPEPEEPFAAVALRPGGRRTIAELLGSAQPVPVGLEEDE